MSWPGILRRPSACCRKVAHGGAFLKLLDEALRRDIHFIDRHASEYPQGLFQCLWNICWWYDCEEAAAHYVEPVGMEPAESPLDATRGPEAMPRNGGAGVT